MTEQAGNISIPFCTAGRVDAEEGAGWEFLRPRITGDWGETGPLLRDYISVMGLSTRQFLALLGAGYAIGQDHDCQGLYCRRSSGSGVKLHPILNNVFFNDLLDNQWYPTTVNSRKMFKVG